jgi:hypothetical protein
MRYISNRNLTGIPTNCRPIARKIFLSKGEIVMEADLYFSTGCVFQVFIKDEKQLFGNYLSGEGVSYYKNLLTETQKNIPEDIRGINIIPEGI